VPSSGSNKELRLTVGKFERLADRLALVGALRAVRPVSRAVVRIRFICGGGLTTHLLSGVFICL